MLWQNTAPPSNSSLCNFVRHNWWWLVQVWAVGRFPTQIFQKWVGEADYAEGMSIAAADASCTRMPDHPAPPVTQTFPKLTNIVTIEFLQSASIPKKGSQKGDPNKSGLIWWSLTTKVGNQGRNPDARPALTSRQVTQPLEKSLSTEGLTGRLSRCRKFPLCLLLLLPLGLQHGTNFKEHKPTSVDKIVSKSTTPDKH